VDAVLITLWRGNVMTDLTLPYEASVDTPAAAFNVINENGQGIAGTSNGWDGVSGVSHSPAHCGGTFSNDAGGIGLWAGGTTAGHFEGNVDVNGTVYTTKGYKFPDGSIQTKAFAGPPGPMGPQGPQGPAGPPGPQGAGIPSQISFGANAGAGYVVVDGPSGHPIAQLANTPGAPDSGAISVTDAAGALANVLKAALWVQANGNGIVAISDATAAAAHYNKAAMFVDSSGNGYVTVTDNSGATALTNRAMMYVDGNGGHFAATGTKSFFAPHPTQAEMDIVYSCIEGPEAAAYVRGTARLVDGHCSISLPDHFVIVASPDNITVQLTPLSSDSLGLAVVSKRVDSIEVRELHHGTGSYEVDWEVKTARKGYEQYQVVRPRVAMGGPSHPKLG
jgi:hypothetical protein